MQDITRQIGIGLRWLPLVVVVAMATALIAYSWSSSQPEVYESTALLYVDPGSAPSIQDLAVAEGAAIRYANQAESRPVALAVVNSLKLDESARSLQQRIAANVSEETLEILIDVRDGTPGTSRALALAVGNELITRVRESLITDEVKAADAAIAANQASVRTLQNRLNQLQRKQPKDDQDRSEIIALTGQISALQRDIQFYQPNSRAFVRNRVKWSERPTTPNTPVEPRPLYWTFLALMVGGMFAAGVAFVLEYLRNHGKIRDEEGLEEATGLLPLGSVTENRRDARRGGADRLVMLRYPRSAAAESYRGVLGRIGFASGTSRTLLVASASETDAKSVVAANLALAYAEAGRNVLLVDADYRAPNLHAFFGVRNERGLTTVLADGDVPLSWVTVATSHPRLGLMPSGPPPREISDPLGSPQLATLLRRLLHASDMVIFDSPSMAGNLDAAVLATHLQESLLVVATGASEREADDAARALHGAEADVVGAVLYRKVRRSRRGNRRPVVPPPAGQGQPPANVPRRIPVAITRPDPAATGQVPPVAATPRADLSVPPAVPPAPTATTGAGGNGSRGPAPTTQTGPYQTPFGPKETEESVSDR